MNPPRKDEIISVKIDGLGHHGEGVGRLNGFTIFVEGALHGEIVKAKVVESRKRYGVAELIQVLSSTPDRIIPSCHLFGECGGCQLMHLFYSKQLEVKQQKVIDALRRIGKIEDCEVAPCIPSPSSLNYRNKIQLPVRKGKEGNITIGLYSRSSHDIVEVKTCHIHCSLGEQVLHDVRSFILQLGIEPFDPIKQTGELRHLLIKSAINTKEALVIFVTNGKPSSLLLKLANEIMKKNPVIKGVVHNIQSGPTNVILGPVFEILEGNGFIHENLCGLTFKISPASFFQVNPDQAEQLYLKALEFSALTGHETILDAYCGVGTLSLLFAKQAKKVIGVECVNQSIIDAEENARLNRISNAFFTCAAAEDFISCLSSIDVVLLNPPRQGCDRRLLEEIGKLSAKKVIYISCDPATLARDLAHLKASGYKIDAVQPFDMFPQTAHVECVVKLSFPNE